MGKRCFHAVYTFNDNALERARRHIKNSSQRQAGKLIAHCLSDVSKQIESCDKAHACRNCMKEHIAKPEQSCNSTLFQKELPVADAGKQLLNNPRNNKVWCNTAGHTQEGKEYTDNVLPLFTSCKIKNPADKPTLCRLETRRTFWNRTVIFF